MSRVEEKLMAGDSELSGYLTLLGEQDKFHVSSPIELLNLLIKTFHTARRMLTEKKVCASSSLSLFLSHANNEDLGALTLLIFRFCCFCLLRFQAHNTGGRKDHEGTGRNTPKTAQTLTGRSCR